MPQTFAPWTLAVVIGSALPWHLLHAQNNIKTRELPAPVAISTQ